MVGTRSCAIRRRNLQRRRNCGKVDANGKGRSSESARVLWQKQQKRSVESCDQYISSGQRCTSSVALTRLWTRAVPPAGREIQISCFFPICTLSILFKGQLVPGAIINPGG